MACSQGPLDGIKVLDLTLALAGPLCTQRLGDMGADVIKIEGPKRPDFTRVSPLRETWVEGETTAYLSLNRNKRSLALDLKTDAGREVFYKLVRNADVVIQNFRPGVAERLGLSFAQLCAVNPKIVYVSISGYGDSGPLVRRPGQDLLVQAFSGATFNAGVKGALPHPAPIYVVDVAASHNACEAVLAGLIQRDRKGVPVEAKVSLLAAVLEIQMQEITTHLTRGAGADRGSAPYASVWMEPPYGIYETSDGFIALAQADLTELATCLSSDRLAEHVRGRPETGAGVVHQHWRDKVYLIVSECLAPLSTDDAVARLEEAGIWCGPVLDYDDLAAHPQAEGLFADVAFKNATLRTLAPAIDFTGHDTAQLRSPPTLGEHSAEILGAIGLSDDEIDSLRRTGVTL